MWTYRKCWLDDGLCYTCQVIVLVSIRGIAHICKGIAGCLIGNSNLEGVLDCACENGTVPLLQDRVLKSVDSDLAFVCQGSRTLLQIEIALGKFPDLTKELYLVISASIF